MPGITTRQMKCSGVWPSGTTYITFEDVKVPVENLIGKENEGFKYVMYNFNHERWGIIVQVFFFFNKKNNFLPFFLNRLQDFQEYVLKNLLNMLIKEKPLVKD